MDPVDFTIFQEICRWGAYENQQKSRNRPDPDSTLQFIGISRRMRSEGWIWSVSRFFRKFADEEPTKINKNLEVVRIQPSHCKFLEFPSKSWNRSIPT